MGDQAQLMNIVSQILSQKSGLTEIHALQMNLQETAREYGYIMLPWKVTAGVSVGIKSIASA
jgi:hypothetical protein